MKMGRSGGEMITTGENGYRAGRCGAGGDGCTIYPVMVDLGGVNGESSPGPVSSVIVSDSEYNPRSLQEQKGGQWLSL